MLGELHDTCNDLCRSEGKNGCDAGKMEEINRIPRATRLLKALGFQCASASSRTFGPTYQPGNEICRFGSGQVDCDQNDRPSDRPLCFCSTETITETFPSVEACLHVLCVVPGQAASWDARAGTCQQQAAPTCALMIVHVA